MEEIIEKFNLPQYLKKSKSFADASNMIMDNFKERKDPASKRTMDDLMGRLREAQEYIKSQSEPQDIQTNENPLDIETQYKYGGNKYNLGGIIGDVSEGFSTGASIGSAIPGVGTAIGGGVGALVGGISNLFDQGPSNRELQMMRDNVQGQRSKVLNTFKYGGNKYQIGGPIDKSDYDSTVFNPDRPLNELTSTNLTPQGIQEFIPLNRNIVNTTPRGYEEKPPFLLEGLGNTLDTIGNTLSPIPSKIGNFLGDNYSDVLRYSPTAINALELANLERPAIETRDRLGTRYSPQYVDEAALQNIAREQFNTTAEALAGASGGSTSALRSNILGAGLNRARSISDAYQRAEAANRAEDRARQQFNLGVDRSNLGQSNLEQDINARNLGAFETERSKLLSALGSDLGSIGKEEKYKDIISRLTGYSPRGKYLRKRNPRARGLGLKALPFATPGFTPPTLNFNN